MQTDISWYCKSDSYKKTMNDANTDVQRGKVESIIRSYPEGVTDMEISLMSGISRTSVTARRNEIPNVIPVGYAKIIHKNGDRLNTLWSIV